MQHQAHTSSAPAKRDRPRWRDLGATATVLLLATALSACQTITPEQRRAADEAQCRSYGFKPRTEAFANCLMRIDLERRLERSIRLNSPYYGPYYGGPGPYWW
ncbi:hypothetical protein MRS76_05460 [Rhizobiaceae bacterium n13]|uniref:Uncharacterized protein n=1 Tax=Ferirhizobium litorale TaxID=2927786 RepID=A0AAE3Q978_9HYPH|nr:hypothetical protein [Fererhizobium litorale]MDI7861395.1 hypothetical protein [Fererhizobium litorale]MDI7921542.1 hypothetical protein [Fererhizobium litorale]